MEIAESRHESAGTPEAEENVSLTGNKGHAKKAKVKKSESTPKWFWDHSLCFSRGAT
jgi:hypothetical protein